MMQVQKGKVEYAGRKDIVITYGQLEDGKQYYFIDGGDLGNGNYIATTKLLEAISSKEEPKNLGIINSDGVEVIPFENKSIKIVNDKYLLVVLANPVSQSVIDVALEKEKVKNSVDSLATSGLITTANAIKESVGTKMALDNGRFIFNDQASEATIYDYDGNNVLNGEYYSFIGLGDTGLYLSKNVVNSKIEQFKFADNKIVSENIDTSAETQEVPVDQNDQSSEEVVNDATLDSSVDFEGTEVNNQEKEVESNSDLDVTDVNIDKEDLEKAIADEMQKTEEVEETSNDVVSETVDSQGDEIEENSSLNEKKMNIEDDSMGQKFASEFKLSLDDYNSEVSNNYKEEQFGDSAYNYHKGDMEKYYDEPVSRGDSILPTAISTMNNLIRQNREQKEKIEVLDNRNNSLKDRIINFENTVSKLENRNQILENQNRQMEDKLHSQSELLERQNRELNSLREKIDDQRRSEAKNLASLANILRDAQGVLTQNNDYDYGEDKFSYGKRVA